MTDKNSQQKDALRRMYEARLAERATKTKTAPLFRLTEVKRESEPFAIQCCIR